MCQLVAVQTPLGRGEIQKRSLAYAAICRRREHGVLHLGDQVPVRPRRWCVFRGERDDVVLLHCAPPGVGSPPTRATVSALGFTSIAVFGSPSQWASNPASRRIST